ncbi:MAG: amidoligase family protein [Oleiphilaceae bacterium]|nr:amidoligase family protein [Oleiphilaceae bacterium]
MYRPIGCKMPPLTRNEDGDERRVGVEIELSGIDYDELVAITTRFLDGESSNRSRYVEVIDTVDGDFLVELDSAPVKDLEEPDERLPEPLRKLATQAMDLFDAAAERIVPLEIVSPPMPLSRLQQIEELCEYLCDQGALGSRHAIYYAFGLQLNPELPSLEAPDILRFLQAFAGLYPLLKSRHQLDISRKFTLYIDPWPEAYVRLIMDDDYNPDLDQLIGDYLHHNPTRNRALDLMPLFAHLRPKRIRREIGDERIKARPTLHYRLPDCDIDNDNWQFATIWNDWVALEELACDPQRLAAFRASYRKRHSFSLENLTFDWIKESELWLDGKTPS